MSIVQKISQDNMRDKISHFYNELEEVENKTKYLLQNFHDRLLKMANQVNTIQKLPE